MTSIFTVYSVYSIDISLAYLLCKTTSINISDFTIAIQMTVYIHVKFTA